MRFTRIPSLPQLAKTLKNQETVAQKIADTVVKKDLVIISDYEGNNRSDDMIFELTDLGKLTTQSLI